MALDIDSAFEYLKHSASAKRLAHAYLITGPAGSGKRQLALRLVSLVNDIPLEKSVADMVSEIVRVVQPESKSRIIKVEQIREMEEMFHQKAMKGMYKVGLIEDADRLTEQAENAFLKTLEEPPHNCLLLLLTAFPEQLFDTILSRCIRVPLRVPGLRIARNEFGDRLRKMLEEVRIDGGVSDALGLAKTFSELLKDVKDQSEEEAGAERKLESESFAKRTDGRWLKSREDFHKAVAQSRYLGRRADLLETLVAWFGDAMRQREGYGRLDFPDHSKSTARLSRDLTVSELGKRMAAVERLRDDFATNVQESLAIEVSFLQAFAGKERT